MLLPVTYLGETKAVLAVVRKDVRAFLDGTDVFTGMGLVDVREHPDALIEVDTQIAQAKGRHFRLSAFAEVLSSMWDRDRIRREDISRWVGAVASSSWASALLLACEARKSATKEDRIHFLRAGATHWAEWSAVGARYTFGAPYGMLLSASPNGVLQMLGSVDRKLADDPTLRTDPEKFRAILADAAARVESTEGITSGR